ncbi:Gfo/Idh/MocA family oxidoreductase [Salmonella enterica]|nr:Gfo/Idh/MocA family oxidoreductase [Salmonella enterica]
MNVLIIGLGYAGNRFLSAFRSLTPKSAVNFACINRRKTDQKLPVYTNVQEALKLFRPDIIVISTTDNQHLAVLGSLHDFDGFIICEKPLATPGDDWAGISKRLVNIKGFAFDLIERYSFATMLLKELIVKNKWSLVRGSFFWGKNRINDYRETCGVMSEVIHPLDLIGWICGDNSVLEIKNIAGTTSDFSVSGDDILDTVLLTAEVNGKPVTGYSSFVNVQRQRNVDFSFTDASGEIIHARLIYDTPSWDCDQIRIWSINPDGSEKIILSRHHENDNPELATILKLSALCRDVHAYMSEGRVPSQPFPGLDTACQLQKTLDFIYENVVTLSPARYNCTGRRRLLPREASLEVLG